MIEQFKKQLESINFKLNEPLARYTTFKIGGPADIFVSPRNEEELLKVLKVSHALALPRFILGGGSNLLISDKGIRGVVIHLSGEMKKIIVSDDSQEIVVGAAASFPKLTKIALELGWEEALGWHGTPGLVGGALKMNAGGRLGEIGSVVQEVRGISISGEHVFSHADAGFQYRNSEFPKDVILTFAKLRRESTSTQNAQILNERAKELVLRRKRTQPKHRSAGSMFKNPPGDFAGRLIEEMGLKGKGIGDAQISEVHANFIVNRGAATAQEVYELSRLAQERVKEKTGISLEYEVKMVGEGF